ncbi:spondin domain-containing protein [Hymenobacter sp. 15J16-1T3B]|uniref:spondin domain-containing protein n=1 Tax=Hymenobacter sp. 15J16-1T3B TaxID=2886941 RepID=UPI001D119912|nr:spondin domain-containing protein [Hymenobacter sp. 15J16-1T3B]MCC3159748.1 spondin domain-containing protein [Hymenobacter sp. 15J16-1T3B]
MKTTRYACLLALLLGACGRDDDAPAEAAPSVLPAVYRVTFEATWSASTHADFPYGAHFSPPMGVSHRADGLVYRSGQLASRGIKDMAELGHNGFLRTEINALRSSGAALALLDGAGGFNSPGTFTDTIRLDAAHPLLTVVTMIAPSPDWFAALESENLLVDGQWVARRSVPARAYDAGTDSGPSFTAPNQATMPAESIRPLHLPPATGTAADGPPVGTWHLERIR